LQLAETDYQLTHFSLVIQQVLIGRLHGLSEKPMILSSVFYTPENIIPQNNYVTENEEGQLTNHLFQLQYCKCNLGVKSKPSQMKLIDKMTNGIEVLAPIIILFVVCAAYLDYTENEKFQPEKFRRGVRQEIEKNKAGNVSDSYLPFRD
jgi:hypothetical protein